MSLLNVKKYSIENPISALSVDPSRNNPHFICKYSARVLTSVP